MSMNELFNFIIVNTDDSFECVELSFNDFFAPENYLDVFYKHKKLVNNNIHLIYDGLLQGESNKLVEKAFGEEGFKGKCILVHYDSFTEEYSGLSAEEIVHFKKVLSGKQ